MSITRAPKISQVAVGQEGQHAIILTEEGATYFAGTARRGEDGDQSKNRRQPKPSRPKKIAKLEGTVIVQAACNNGSSALVSREGELFIFGKDSSHADYSTGIVTELKNVPIAKVKPKEIELPELLLNLTFD